MLEAATPGRTRYAVARTGWVLVVAATLALAAALTPLLAWSEGAEESLWARSMAAAIAVLLLGPVASLVAALAWWREPGSRGVAVLVAVTAAVAGWIAWVQLSDVRDQHIGLGGPIAVLASAGLVAGWLLVATGCPGGAVTGGGALPWLVAVCALGLLVAGTVPAVDWYRLGRFVDHITAGPLPELPAAEPTDLTQERWRLPISRGRLVGTAGRYAVLRVTRYAEYDDTGTQAVEYDDTGIRVVDGETGAEHWRYLRTDLRAEEAVLTSDGELVVVLFTSYEQRWLLALETATGQVRWRRDLPEDALAGDDYVTDYEVDLLAAGDAVVLTTQCGIGARHQIRRELLDYRCGEEDGELWAVAAGTGETRWRWAPEPVPLEGDDGPAEAPCYGVTAAPAGDTVVVQVECPTASLGSNSRDEWLGPAHQQFVGIAAADGAERWRHGPPELADHLLGPRGRPPDEEEPVLAPLGDDAVLFPITGPYQAPDGTVVDPPTHWVTLAGSDGAVRSTVETDGELLAVTEELVLYVEGHAPTELVGVDPSTGEQHWRSGLPGSGPGQVQTVAASSGQTGYVLRFRGELDGYQLRPSGGEMALLTIDLGTGTVTEAGRPELASLVCPREPCLALAGGGLVLVTAPPGELAEAELLSLG